MSLNPDKVYISTGVNVTLYGEEEERRINLGRYSTDFHLHSDTNISYESLRDLVKQKINYQLPVFQKRGDNSRLLDNKELKSRKCLEHKKNARKFKIRANIQQFLLTN